VNTCATDSTANPRTKPPLGLAGTILLGFFGVVLPAATLVIELVSHWCASILFDPIPSPAHVALVALVPLANVAAIAGMRGGRADWLAWLGWLNGAAIGAAGLYALLFLPFSPFAAIGILFFGAGLLPLSPPIALVCAIVLRVRLRRLARIAELKPPPGLWLGMSAAILLVSALEAPKLVTFVGLQMATSGSETDEASGIRLLRAAGNRDELLRACYVQSSGVFGDPLSFLFTEFGRRVPESQARAIYYRVTGTPFNAVKPPDLRGLRGRGDWWMDDLDFGQGGDQVLARTRGLTLADSRLDAAVDAADCTAYTEWILVFHNASTRQQEARAQVALPRGSVVSRLTLWIDGQEREAAFGSRSQVRQAYERVVARRRDPVLVTTSGPDQILVQCFPVPPNNGTMKLRIGITSPLDLDSLSSGLLRLPFIVERNFNIPESLAHAVWIESRGRLSAGRRELTEAVARGGGFALRGDLKGATLDEPVAVAVARDPAATITSAPDARGGNGFVVRQQVRERAVTPPGRLAIVLDGSRRMGDHAGEVAEALQGVPDGLEFAVLQASDRVIELAPVRPAGQESRRTAMDAIRSASFAGGCDNAKALARAWDIAAASTNGAILWLHATQPVEFGGVEALRQRWERRPHDPILLDRQFDNGPNLILQKLDGLSGVQRLARAERPADDLARLMALWSGKAVLLDYERERVPEASAARKPETPPNGHLVRLWANEEIRRLAASRRDEDRQQALTLATTYQLVTPVSGAVVLETSQQYQEAGLEPVPASSVPSVPEPEFWMLLAVGAILFVILLRKHRQQTA
jgi:hypothetical protein